MILYGELGTPEFAEFHNLLKHEALEGNIDYVVRHYVRVSDHFLNMYMLTFSKFTFLIF